MQRKIEIHIYSRARHCALMAAMLSLILALAAPASVAIAASRIALVVGVSKYEHAGVLPNTINDANDMTAALRRLGFDVETLLNPIRAELEAAVRRYGKRSSGAEVALFHYSGHALEAGGQNWILPSTANIHNERDLRFEAIDLNAILEQTDGAARVSIIFLDACRDNPVSRRLSSTHRGVFSPGLARLEVSATGILVSFAAAPGQVALDAVDDKNSPFTAAILRHIETPGLEIKGMMARVTKDVVEATKGKQRPWQNSSLEGEFYFTPLPSTAPSVSSATPNVEIAFWNSVKDSKNPQLFEAYLRRYPNGAFADIAKISLDQVKVAIARPLAAAPDQKAAIRDTDILQKVHDRLYELNFDPSSAQPAGMSAAIREFEAQSNLPQTGEATEGLLARLREIGGLKPWGAIVYDRNAGKWGMAWDQPSRKDAVANARSRCGTARCSAEISFFGTGCGAFALSSASWSIVSRDDIEKARQGALDACGKHGKVCRIVGASCADGAGRTASGN